jgi:carboxyl-terminal processing protease
MKFKFRPLAILGLVVSITLAGLLLAPFMIKTAFAVGKDRYGDLQLFAKVLNLVEQHYVEDVDTKKLIYGGIKGMLSSLDPHTNFLPPDIFKEFKVETSGEFGGVGIEISVQDDVLTVMSPIEDTPAWKAGIKAGDKIIEIDGKTTKGISLAEAVSKMRGKKGSNVVITIWREGFEKPQKFTVARDIIKVRSVKYTDLENGYAYARITSFIERTGEDLDEALASHEKKHGKVKGLVIDLRNNAGGLLEQAIRVCNEFIGEGVIVSTMGRNKKDKDVIYAKKEGARTDFPIVLLINEYSASASEIVAGALQDHKRAVIMGTRSFGKGSVQSVVELGDGAGLKLTVARYYTPNGRSIQAHGIEPDVSLDAVDTDAYEKAVIHRKSLRESDIEGHLEGDDEKSEVPEGRRSESFWKEQKAAGVDVEKEKAKEKAEEDAKLTPSQRLLKRDYQVLQAFNYLKSWTIFKQIGVPAAQADEPKSTVKLEAGAAEPAKPAGDANQNGKVEKPLPPKKTPKAKKEKKASGAPAPAAASPAAGPAASKKSTEGKKPNAKKAATPAASPAASPAKQ